MENMDLFLKQMLGEKDEKDTNAVNSAPNDSE